MPFFERPAISLYLVRHGQSAANADKNLYRTIADHAIPLTELGERQAKEVGQFLRTELAGKKTIVLHSAYIRARQTEQLLCAGLQQDCIAERVELVEMAEQQLGLFDGVPEEERKLQFPEEYSRFQLMHDVSGRFFARPPQGDSPFDIYNRATRVVDLIKFAAKHEGIENFVLVGHGNWFACFQMAWLNLPFEWYAAHRTPWNAEVIKIEGDMRIGTIFQPQDATQEASHAPQVTAQTV